MWMGAVLPLDGREERREHDTMSNGEVLETSADGTMRLVLHLDTDPQNPREDYDHLCHVASAPSCYYAPVDKDAGPYAVAWETFQSRRIDAPEIFARYVRMLGGAAEWYSPHYGSSAVWYLTREDIAREGNPTDPSWAQTYIRGEAEEYAAWADGEVYGYVIEQRSDWARQRVTDGEQETREGWETLDSCWGFYGHEYAVEAAQEAWACVIAP